MPRYNKSKYTAEKSSEIRFNIIGALDELAINKGIDIKTMQTTEPYSFVLNGITSQKITQELKKMVDTGLVVKESARGQTMKYMLRAQYEALFKEGEVVLNRFGYGDYRDDKDEDDEEVSETVCARIIASAVREKHEPMW